MSILNGTGTTQPKEIWYGNNQIKEVWVGDNKIWPTGPQSDAQYWFDFDDDSARLKNKGLTRQGVAVTGTFPVFDHDHAIFEPTTNLNTTPTTNWVDGYSVSMWTKDTPPSSGWKTIIHRAVSSGTLTNEAYVVYDTSATATTIASGLKFGSVHKEYLSNYSVPVSTGWFHTVVTWRRLTTTSYNCTFYINGVQRGSFTASGYASNTKFSTEKLYIGGNRSFGEWSGRIDDLIIWDRGLSAAEVTELYNQGRSWIPRITTASPMSFAVGEPGSMLLATDFGATTWTATGLPDGLTLSTAGLLSGTPTTVGSGVMTLTASSDLYSATKAITWDVIAVPNTVLHTLKARSANKVSHSGWNKPALTWDLVTTGSASYTSSGEIIPYYGRGRVWAQPALVNTRNTRVVSSVRGVLASGSQGNASYYSPTVVFQEGERIYLEIENYSSNTNDSISLSVAPPA